MFPSGGWYNLALKKLSPLLRGTTLKYNDDFCCVNYLHSFRTKNELGLHKRVKIKIFLT